MTLRGEVGEAFLFTDGFPWGVGEKPFVVPELSALAREYHVTVVSLVSEGIAGNEDSASELSEEIELLRWRRHPKLRRALWAFSMPFSRAGRSELRSLICDGFSWGRLRDSAVSYANARSLQEFCRSEGVFEHAGDSLYLCFWFSTQCLALALEKRENPQMKMVSRIHGYDLYNERQARGRQPWQRFMRDACNRIIFLDDKAERYFEGAFGHESFGGQYVVNGLGVDAGNPTPDLPDGEKIRVVSCSSVTLLKRVDLLARALGRLPTEAIEWIHFGNGPELDRVRAIASDVGVNAMFMGHVHNNEVKRYYAENHVEAFVMVSSSEGVPVSIMEALASGIPVVATDVGGVSSQIDGNGVLLPANPTEEQVADAVREVCLASAPERERMRSRSFEIWREKYDVKRNKEGFLSILHEVTSDDGGGSCLVSS